MENEDEKNDAGRVFLWLAVAAFFLLIMSGCASTEEKQARRDAQVSMIQTQVDAETQQNIAEATARTALYEAMARVAANSPDSADAIAVALAVSSVKDSASEKERPLIQLQQERNEAAEIVKAIAPALITTVGTIGVAAIQGETNRAASENARDIAIADSASDADIMRSVTGMATAGLANAGTAIGGDYYVAGGGIDQSVTTTNTSTNTSNNTETNTWTTTTDSYNPSSDTYTTSNTYNQQTYQTAGGEAITYEELRDLVLQGLNFTVVIDGEEVTVEPANCPDGSDGLTFGGGEVVCG